MTYKQYNPQIFLLKALAIQADYLKDLQICMHLCNMHLLMAISELLAGFAEMLQNVITSVFKICSFILLLQIFSNIKLFLISVCLYSAAYAILYSGNISCVFQVVCKKKARW